MISLGNGKWVKDLMLPSGSYEYRFVVDGKWIADPTNSCAARNPFDESNSIKLVDGGESENQRTHFLHQAKSLMGYSLGANDGEIGRVKDMLFDDVHWVVRYLVASTGKWLPKRKVLISPFAIGHVHVPESKIAVNLTKYQIEHAPSIDEDQPVSRQMEAEFYRYYNWPYYWPGPYVWGPYSAPYIYPAAEPQKSIESHIGPPEGDQHLRSMNEVRHYHIQGLDQEFGHVEDFLLDEFDWAIRYFVVDTRNWWPGKHVLLPTDWISAIDWSANRVHVDLDRETLQRAPEYDHTKPVSRDYEARLYAFLNREPYWVRQTHAVAAKE